MDAYLKPVEATADTVCSICLDPVDKGVQLTVCSHVYHRGCITKWLQRKPVCPQCRTKLPIGVDLEYGVLAWVQKFEGAAMRLANELARYHGIDIQQTRGRTELLYRPEPRNVSSPDEIDLVMAQANVRREDAVAALERHNGDIVNAIMQLTESPIDPRDIELVTDQTGVSHARAEAALALHNGDIVDAIMELTM